MKALRLTWLLIGAALYLVAASLTAQEATPEPVVSVTAADIGADAAGFTGTTVSLQGRVVEFVSPNAFIFSDDSIGEGVTPLLVINNSGQPLPNLLLKGGPVSLVGRVVPSNASVMEGVAQPLDSFYTTRMNYLDTSGAQGALPAGDVTPAATQAPGAEATADPMLAPTPDAVAGNRVDPTVVDLNDPGATMTLLPYQEDMMNWLYTILPADYAGHAVIELTDLNLMVIPIEEAVG
jgi:hypothetical protein